jgi:hypothetical protein
MFGNARFDANECDRPDRRIVRHDYNYRGASGGPYHEQGLKPGSYFNRLRHD